MTKMINRLFGCIGAIFFLPFALFIAITLWIMQGRPLFFRQSRLGINRSPFICFKFRTMEKGVVTPLGRVLRATGLDELPQFINIMRGEMNAVGPRPITEDDAVRLGYLSEAHLKRWSVKPGLTGLSQLLGGHNAADSFALDMEYIKAKSMWYDIRIVLITFLVNAFGKGRVRRLLAKFDIAL